MGENQAEKNLYRRRVEKEQNILEQQIQERMRWDKPLLSQNSKCGVSLDLPLINCKPTNACASVCYASQGRQYYSRAIIKSLAVNRMILTEPERAARKVVNESQGVPIRIAGSGEILPDHKPFLDSIEEYGGSYWGFTRRVDTHHAIPSLMFSFDATSAEQQLHYLKEHVPVHRRAYLQRNKDPPAPIEVAVTFPTHGPQTNQYKTIPVQSTDCPAIRKTVKGCWECQRCY